MSGGGNSGGVYSPTNLALFTYTHNNPVNFIDPDGNDIEVLIGGPYGDHGYGHAALRVFGDGYDKTYDFGRYGETRGLLGSEGEGVLRVWNNNKQYIKGENATGRTTTGYMYKTDSKEDKAIIGSFDKMVNNSSKSKKDPYKRDMKSSVLQDDYNALTNNCTTKTIEGVRAGRKALGEKFANPKESKGRGLGFMEKVAAGDAVGTSIFMPADLQKNIENTGGYYQKNTYNNTK